MSLMRLDEKMKSKSLLAVLVILIGGVFGYADQTRLKAFARPAAAENVAGLDKPACVQLDSATKICQGLAEDSAAGAVFVVMRDGVAVSRWESEVFLGETADYQVFTAELDGGGSDELIVANRNSISNGMSINYWTIAILPFPMAAEKINPVQFQTEDFSPAMFAPRRRNGGFDITAANWETLPVKKSSRRTALYLVGRGLIYRNNDLETLDRPIAVRRYTKSFERERLKNIDEKNDAYFGLISPAVEKRQTEPLVDLIIESEIDGVIENVSFDASEGNSAAAGKITARTKAGETVTLTFAADSEESKNTFDYIGNFAQQRLYPKGYLSVSRLKGKIFKLIGYAGAKNEAVSRRILWLTD